MEKNSFDGVRIGLALIVVFAHAAALTQVPDFRLLGTLFDSNFAVKGFFAISGFLVTKSYMTSKTTLEYAEKRLRRIYPAYIATVVFCLVIGVFVSSMHIFDFLGNSQTVKYLVANLTFLNFIQPTLPGVFEENPLPALNGSLWTIKVEVMLYFCVPLIVFLFTKFGATTSALFLILLSILWAYFFSFTYSGSIGAELARQFPGQLSYFVFGSYLAMNPKALANIKWVALLLFASLFFTDHPQLRIFLDPFAYSVIVIYLSTLSQSYINFGKLGDISYGLYLYHFPIIQLLIYLQLFSTPWLGLSLTLAITIVISLISWHAIEKRLLKRSSHYVRAAEEALLKSTPQQP